MFQQNINNNISQPIFFIFRTNSQFQKNQVI